MKIYPNPAWPADSTILALDGTLDVPTGLPFIAKGTGPTSSPSYEIQYNRRQQRQNQILAACRQGMVVDEGGLNIGVYPIEYTLNGQRKSFLGATGMGVPDNAARVVYLDSSAVLQVAAAWPADMKSYLALAEITTASGMMEVLDRRVYALFQVPASSYSYLNGSCAQIGANQSASKVLEFKLPADTVLAQVQVFCTATAGTVSVDVKEAGVSVLSAPAAPAAGTLVTPTIADPAIAGASSLTVHVTTNASGSVSNLLVTLVLRS